MIIVLFQWDWWFLRSPADLLEMWSCLNWLSRGILLVLLVMLAHAVVTTAAMAMKHAMARRQSRRFEHGTKGLLSEGQLEEVMAAALKLKKSHVASVVVAGLRAFRALPSSLSDEEARGCAERTMERTSSMIAAEMKLGLGSLRTIAGIAPLLGAFGTMLGILGSFRGYSGTPFGFVLMVLSGLSLALMFVLLGLLVAVPSLWAHNWLVTQSSNLEVEMESATLEMMSYLGAHPEWRWAAEAEVSLGWMDQGGVKGHPWEVAYDGHGLLIVSVWMFELFFFYVVVRGGWSSSSADNAFRLGLFLLIAGVLALWVRWKKGAGPDCAAGNDAYVNDSFYHESIERRRKGLPLRERLAVLPNRGAVFGAPALVLMALMILLNNSPVPMGIPVEIASRGDAAVSATAENELVRSLVVHLEQSPEADPSSRRTLIRLQGKPVPEGELRPRLTKAFAGCANLPVFIYGDDDLPFQAVVNVADLVNELDGRPVLVGAHGVRTVE